MTPIAVQMRGPCEEAVTPFSWAAVDARGRVVASAGEDVSSTWRSAAKPFQLACSLAALGDPDVTEEEVAVGAASHSAEPRHVELVRGVLARFGVEPSALRCGAHPPIHEPSAAAILRAGASPTDLHNNCSGKHAFMLAASARNGWGLDYLAPEHPLQREIAARLAEWTGEELAFATDGCGLPTFGLALSGMARAWARLAAAMAAVAGGATAADAHAARVGRIGWAMARHPELTSGTGRLDLAVVRAAREEMAVKIGALGVFCIALPRRGLGVAVKVRSGSGDALGVAVSHALAGAAPGAWAEPEAWTFRSVKNVAGRVVGAWEAREG